MKSKKLVLSCLVSFAVLSATANAADKKLVDAIEVPDAAAIIKKDFLKPAQKYTMPKGCISDDKDSIARGSFIFHNLNGKKAKSTPPKGLAKFITKGDKKKPKQYGNCVACHNIEGAKGAGNIGPDLTGYKANFIDTKARDNAFVYQKIADPRVDNKNTHMTVNLTTGLFTEQEICDISSYIVSKK
jgi:sulfur-oxidizing protein SoxX